MKLPRLPRLPRLPLEPEEDTPADELLDFLLGDR